MPEFKKTRMWVEANSKDEEKVREEERKISAVLLSREEGSERR